MKLIYGKNLLPFIEKSPEKAQTLISIMSKKLKKMPNTNTLKSKYQQARSLCLRGTHFPIIQFFHGKRSAKSLSNYLDYLIHTETKID